MAQITFTIPDAKLAEFKSGFLAVCPVPVVNAGPDTAPVLQPLMSENEWIKRCGYKYYMDLYRQGKTLLAKQLTIIDEGVINE